MRKNGKGSLANPCSFKHAFHGVQIGEIIIRVYERGENVILEYADNGIGPPEEFDWKNINSLGLKLVRNLVERQLAGAIELCRRNGIKFVIQFNKNTSVPKM